MTTTPKAATPHATATTSTPVTPAAVAKKPVVRAKAVKTAKQPVAAAKAVPATKPAKVKKPKLVRDSFTIPKPEYTVLDDLKLRAIALAQPAKKSELLRAGIKALAAMSDATYLAALQAVPTIKTGRPAAPTKPAAKPAAKKAVKKA